MDTIEMLNRIKTRDFKAYCQLTEDYGWKLYSRIRERFDDAQKANAVFNETLSCFCSDLTDHEGDDALDALLLAYAEKVCSRMEQNEQQTELQNVQQNREEQFVSEVPDDSEDIMEEETAPPKKDKVSTRGSFGFRLCIFLLLLGILAVIWIILGLLMDMNLIPQLDLGYTWFNANIAPWF